MADTEEMEEMDTRDSGPLPMKFFSTWEVRKVPPNCVSRSVLNKHDTINPEPDLAR